MAATIAAGLLATQLLLLLCTTTATATVTIPAVVNGAAPPAAPATDVGAGGLPKLPSPFPFPGGRPHFRFPFPGGLPHFRFPFPRGIPQLPFPGGNPGGGIPRFPFPGDNPGGGIPRFPFHGGNPAASAQCLKAVHQSEGCVGDVLLSLASSRPGEDAPRAGSNACCGALQAVGDRCFRGVLPVSPLRALYAPLVRHACRGGGGLPGQDHLVTGPA